MNVFLNGRILPASRARVSIFDHSFLYGDGIYETVRAYGCRLFRWPEHDRRLRRSARRIRLACPWSSSFLRDAAQRLLRANREPNGSVRITISRGPGPLGLDPAVCPKPTVAMMLHPGRDGERLRRHGVSIGIPRVRRNPPESLDPRIKSNNGLNIILAKLEARRLGVFECVLLNRHGRLTEGTTSNIFFIRGRALYTPALSCGLLEGVTRAAVVRLARAAGYRVVEGAYRPEHLKAADEAFLTSTTLEIVPIVRLVEYGAGTSRFRSTSIGGGRPGSLTVRLHQLFRDEVRAEMKRELAGLL